MAWERRVEDLESIVSVVVDVEAQPRKRNTERAVRLADEDTHRSQITDARARVVATMDGLGAGVKGILVRMWNMMDKLRLDLIALIRGSSYAACEVFLKLAVADFMT